MPKIGEYMRSRAHSDEEYRELIDKVRENAEKIEDLDALREQVSMLTECILEMSEIIYGE